MAINFIFGKHSGNKTVRPKKGSSMMVVEKTSFGSSTLTIGDLDLKQAVKLPYGEDLDEWIAYNVVDFFSQINMLYSTLTDYCTKDTCPTMSAGSRYEYFWADGNAARKPVKLPASEYINCLMSWVQCHLENESLFPSKIGVAFPRGFQAVVRTILKRLFRVYAHIYCQHFDEVISLQEEAHLNTSFKHFVYFVMEFKLMEKREMEPLKGQIDTLCA